jgi:hypothetical protein
MKIIRFQESTGSLKLRADNVNDMCFLNSKLKRLKKVESPIVSPFKILVFF